MGSELRYENQSLFRGGGGRGLFVILSCQLVRNALIGEFFFFSQYLDHHPLEQLHTVFFYG